MPLQFTRNANVYVQLMDPTNTANNKQAWKLGVLDGFSFTQSVNSSEITINEAGTTSRRARLLFNDSLAPVEWSFSTYVRPKLLTTSPDTTNAPEECLWAMLMGSNDFNTTTKVFSNQAVSPPAVVNAFGANTNTFNFNGSNVSSFGDNWRIYFSFEESGNTQVYRIDSAVANSATIDFDIDGIATIQWSGFGKALVDAGTSVPADLTAGGSPAVLEDNLTATDNFIRNRISTVGLVRTDVSPDDTYDVVLTGGSFTVENNISYLTPEELGVVNSPLANITGARSISGSLTCYLDNDAANDKSGELFADLVADTSTVRNTFNMEVNLGGAATSTPRLTLDLPTAHVEIPTVNVEDLLTLEINFHGQVASGNVDSTNEATIIYKT